MDDNILCNVNEMVCKVIWVSSFKGGIGKIFMCIVSGDKVF